MGSSPTPWLTGGEEGGSERQPPTGHHPVSERTRRPLPPSPVLGALGLGLALGPSRTEQEFPPELGDTFSSLSLPELICN